MGGEEAERDQEADERMEDGAAEDVADEIKCEVVGPGLRRGRWKTGCRGNGFHCLDDLVAKNWRCPESSRLYSVRGASRSQG